ncbi:TNF receptor-associated factor 2-like [Ornithodoros turicata]|uniref:TNF receptor-associated factor 2-like n=1 Tax=Ornithodoros turicata TaxID=34597 RepID=UPI0031392557
MAAGESVKYFTGFSTDINWRSTKLVSSLQRIRSCSLCGVVPNETQVLPCSHGFCASCYQMIRQRNLCCPIEGLAFTESQVNVMEFPEEHLLTRQVHCWNADNGCQFVGSLLEVNAHFHRECSFHHVICTRCNSCVLRRNILDHYEQGCRKENDGVNVMANDILRSSKATEAILTRLAHIQASLQDNINKLSGEALTGIRDVKSSVAIQARKLNEIKEKQAQLHQSCSVSLKNLDSSVHSMPAVIRHRDWVRKLASAVFNISSSKICWVVTDIEKHRSDARQSPVQVVSDKFLLANYTARLCLKFIRDGGNVDMHLFFNICRGPDDDSLEWPFILPLRISLIHPKDRQKTKARGIDPPTSSYPHCYYRPVEDNNTGEGGIVCNGDNLDDFIVSNSLLLSAELRAGGIL